MNRNSKLRDRLRDATNQAILAAAEAVFAEEGLHAAKVETIAAMAGVSVGTIYNHLGDRDSVLTTLLHDRKIEMLERMDAALHEGEGRPFPEQVRAFLRVVLQHFDEHAPFFHICMQGEVYQKTSQARETMCAVNERVDELIARGVRSGQLRSELSDLYAAFLLGSVRNAFMRPRLLGRETRPLLPQLDEFVHVFLNGAMAAPRAMHG